MIEIETHPNWYFPIPNMQILFLGTYPPHKKRWDFDFYYPNNKNHFWKALAKINDTQLTKWTGIEAVEERQTLMKALRLGVQNMGLVIERKDQSSLDKNILITEYQDILSIIKDHEDLRTIVLTGYSGATSAYQCFIRYLKLNYIPHTNPQKIIAGNTFTVHADRPIKCFIANSTSTSAIRIRFETIVEQFVAATQL